MKQYTHANIKHLGVFDAFLESVRRGEVPARFPVKSNPRDFIFSMEAMNARELCTKRGMWAIVDKTWTRKLATWIGKRAVLEVMAGAGWLARALTEHGVNIIATDSGAWAIRHPYPLVFPVEQLDGLVAVRTHSADLLLVSWPPYDEDAICEIGAAWGKPIIYIGEGKGGCNAPDEWFEHWRPLREPEIAIPQWYGIHDYLEVGMYG